jgi:hypothetical protein
VPFILGAGERLFEDVGDPVLEPIKGVASPAVTHIKYRIAKKGFLTESGGDQLIVPYRSPGRGPAGGEWR